MAISNSLNRLWRPVLGAPIKSLYLHKPNILKVFEYIVYYDNILHMQNGIKTTQQLEYDPSYLQLYLGNNILDII
jgi:hypothetical protein